MYHWKNPPVVFVVLVSPFVPQALYFPIIPPMQGLLRKKALPYVDSAVLAVPLTWELLIIKLSRSTLPLSKTLQTVQPYVSEGTSLMTS